MEKTVKFFRGKVRSVDPTKFTAAVVISDESKDRYDERVLVSSFTKTKKEFMKHPVLLSSHAYRGLMNQIGMFEKLTIDSVAKEVVGKVKWFVGEGNPEADWGFKLVEKGIAAFSIGFIPKTWKDYSDDERVKNGGVRRDYEDIELLETSQVLVPANPAALQKSFDDDEHENEAADIDAIIRTFQEEYKDFFTEEEVETESLEDEIENKKWEETENEIRHRVREPELFSEFRHIKIKKDKPRVNAIYGKLKEKDEWKIQALRFPKADDWTVASAKEWVKAHPDLLKTLEDADIVFMMAEEEVEERLEEVETGVKELLEEIVGKIELLSEEMRTNSARLLVLESKTEPIDKDKEIEDKPDDMIGEEKMEELAEEFRKAYSREQGPSLDEVRGLFEEMTQEIKAKFSVQS